MSRSFRMTTRMGRSISGLVFEKIEEHTDNELGIILIHAFPLSSEMYIDADQIFNSLESLTKESRTSLKLILPDLPGFGESALFAEPPNNLDWYVDSINDIVKYFDLDRVILGGCSMGGYIIFEYAKKYSSSALILIDTKMEKDTEEMREARIDTAKKFKTAMMTFPDARSVGQLSLRSKSIRDYLDSLCEKLVSKSCGEKVRLRSIIDAQRPEAIRQALYAMAGRGDSTEFLETYNGKILIIVGEEDKLSPIKNAKEMKEKAKYAELFIVRGAGHLVPFEKAEYFREKLTDWIRSQILV